MTPAQPVTHPPRLELFDDTIVTLVLAIAIDDVADIARLAALLAAADSTATTPDAR